MKAATPIGTFAAENAGKAPSVVGRALLGCEPLKSSSDAVAQSAEAQTACPSRDGPDLDHHFVAFVRSPTGRLLELDGRSHATPLLVFVCYITFVAYIYIYI